MTWNTIDINTNPNISATMHTTTTTQTTAIDNESDDADDADNADSHRTLNDHLNDISNKRWQWKPW